MLILGILSVLQAIFLPGYLVLRYFRVRSGLLQTLLLAFALSLTANFWVGYLLVLFGAFRIQGWLAVLVLELILLSRLPREDSLRTLLRRDFDRCIALLDRLRRRHLLAFMGSVAALGAAGLVIWNCLSLLRESVGTVFILWDPALSWNRWAWEWAESTWPTTTYHYPQLIPVTWALTYVFTGDARLEFFAKSIMALFPLALVLVPLELALQYCRFRFVVAAVAIGTIIPRLMGVFLASGYVDVPVAFMALATVYLLLLARTSIASSDTRRYLLLAAIVAAGTALTKQSGLYVVLLFPFIARAVLIGGRMQRPPFSAWRPVLAVWLVAWAFSLPWYLHNEVGILLGHNRSETGHVIFQQTGDFDPHAGRGLMERVTHGTELLHQRLGSRLEIALLFGLAGALAMPLWRSILLYSLPYLLLWAATTSYDIRNSSLMVPTLVLSAAMGLAQLGRISLLVLHLRPSLPGRLGKLIRVLKAGAQGARPWLPRSAAPMLGIVCALLLLGWISLKGEDLLSTQALVRWQREERVKHMGPVEHALLVLSEHYQKHRTSGAVLTNLKIAKNIRGIREMCVVDALESSAALTSRSTPTIRYLLVFQRPDLTPFLRHGIAAGAYRLLDQAPDHMFLEVIRDRSGQ